MERPGASVVINEFMNNPEGNDDTTAEWIELFNASLAPVDITGWSLWDEGADSHVIQGGILAIPPGGYLLLANSNNPQANGGIDPDYVYPGLDPFVPGEHGVDVLRFTLHDAGGDGLPTDLHQVFVQAGPEQSFVTEQSWDKQELFNYGLQIIAARLHADSGEVIDGLVADNRLIFGERDTTWLSLPDGQSATFTVEAFIGPQDAYSQASPSDLQGTILQLKLSGLYDVSVAPEGSQMSRDDTVVLGPTVTIE